MSSNVTQSHTNGATNGDTAPLPATRLLASFVANASVNQLTTELRDKVKEVIIDYVGVVVGALDNAESTDAIYRAIVALQGKGNAGKCTVLGKGEPHMLPQYAGLLNSAFGHSMDFDDTYAEGSLHAGVTAISAAMTEAEVLGEETNSELFMLAVAVSYEVTCRLGAAAGMAAYDRGFHNTSTAGVFGAVAAISVLRRLPPETVEMALGLAGSKAAGSMQYLDNGSWNKRLHPGFAVHDAFMCVGLAEAGVIGASRIIEGVNGFLNAYTPKPDPDLHRLTSDLGKDWHWLESSLKPYPACRMTHGFIELCGNIHDRHGGKVVATDLKTITLTMSPFCNRLIGDPIPNKIHPENTIDGQFSAYFQVANTLVYGSNTGLQAYQRILDKDIHAICNRITVKTDSSMVGFAAKMQIEWANGEVENLKQDYPLGEVQHPFTRDRVDAKFLGLASPVYGKEKARRIIETIDAMERHRVEDLLVLLR